jgi:uncharacterized repeat protein (TIGR01451 family)
MQGAVVGVLVTAVALTVTTFAPETLARQPGHTTGPQNPDARGCNVHSTLHNPRCAEAPLVDISVTKIASTTFDPTGATVRAGFTIVYTIEVCNEGEGTATDITFLDQLPLAATFQLGGSADFTLGNSTSQFTGQLDELVAGECATAFFTVSVPDDAACGTQFQNVVEVSSDGEDSNAADNQDTFVTTVVCG